MSSPPYRHIHHCPLRWGDMDAQGHVNNALWVDYLQEARVDYLIGGPLAELLSSGVLVVSHQVEHLAAVVPDEVPLRIELWICEVGGARFGFGYDLFHHEQHVGRARTDAVPYDLRTGQLRRLSAQERSLLERHRHPAPDLRPLVAAMPDEAVVLPCSVRWSDLDAYGHVNNAKYYDYVQQARVDWFGSWAPSGSGSWVVARQDMRYLAPMDHRATPYGVRLGIAGTGRTSMTLAAEVVDPGSARVHARAQTVVVRLDDRGRPVPLPHDLAVPTAAGAPARVTG